MFDIESYLDSLPEDTEIIDVSHKGICYLNVTRFKNLKTLCCQYNYLTSLQLNENLQELNCSYNKLTSLQLNEKLEYLACNNNQLTYLHLNEKLEYVNCQNNQLISLGLNEKLEMSYNKIIRYNNNPICEIIGGTVALKQLKILNKFRYLYYSLKFKKRFRDLLWVKIREPKIREKYSHDYLIEHLHEDTDLDELLDNWI